uniref:glutaminase n=1 Tax=Cyprinus carpio TaxID=7962 RepID=A0A8C2EFC3_CYPCA
MVEFSFCIHLSVYRQKSPASLALAATLGNGGLCPLSGDQVMSPHAIRSMLSMMQVAGMNDYSRMFHFKTSVPGKSSQSGVVLIVVPGVLGLMCWSPGLGCNGNSWRGVHFCEVRKLSIKSSTKSKLEFCDGHSFWFIRIWKKDQNVIILKGGDSFLYTLYIY